MDVNTINPVLEAVLDILPQIGFQHIAKKNVRINETELINPGVLTNIGVSGPLKGSILIGMNLDTAKYIASTMMMGMPVAELDDMAQSAISEMGNMVCANACIKLSQAGINGLDISPPVLIIGAGGSVTLAVNQVINVCFEVDSQNIEIFVSLS